MLGSHIKPCCLALVFPFCCSFFVFNLIQQDEPVFAKRRSVDKDKEASGGRLNSFKIVRLGFAIQGSMFGMLQKQKCHGHEKHVEDSWYKRAQLVWQEPAIRLQLT